MWLHVSWMPLASMLVSTWATACGVSERAKSLRSNSASAITADFGGFEALVPGDGGGGGGDGGQGRGSQIALRCFSSASLGGLALSNNRAISAYRLESTCVQSVVAAEDGG